MDISLGAARSLKFWLKRVRLAERGQDEQDHTWQDRQDTKVIYPVHPAACDPAYPVPL